MNKLRKFLFLLLMIIFASGLLECKNVLLQSSVYELTIEKGGSVLVEKVSEPAVPFEPCIIKSPAYGFFMIRHPDIDSKSNNCDFVFIENSVVTNKEPWHEICLQHKNLKPVYQKLNGDFVFVDMNDNSRLRTFSENGEVNPDNIVYINTETPHFSSCYPWIIYRSTEGFTNNATVLLNLENNKLCILQKKFKGNYQSLQKSLFGFTFTTSEDKNNNNISKNPDIQYFYIHLPNGRVRDFKPPKANCTLYSNPNSCFILWLSENHKEIWAQNLLNIEPPTYVTKMSKPYNIFPCSNGMFWIAPQNLQEFNKIQKDIFLLSPCDNKINLLDFVINEDTSFTESNFFVDSSNSLCLFDQDFSDASPVLYQFHWEDGGFCIYHKVYNPQQVNISSEKVYLTSCIRTNYLCTVKCKDVNVETSEKFYQDIFRYRFLD